MASAIGDLVVRLGATTAPFDKKMKTAQTTMGRMRSGVGRLAGSLRGMGGVFGAVSVGGMAMMIRANLNIMDATGKLSDRLGIATEKLQGLRHAAEISGAGSDTLDKSMEFLSKSLGEATMGTGEAMRAIEMLNLRVGDLINLRPDRAFALIADKTRLLATQQEKAYVATKLFGRSGMALVNTLDLGSKGLAEMQREAERLGIAFDRGVAAKAEVANDALTRLGQTMKGMQVTMTADLAPALTHLADQLSKVVPGALQGTAQGFLYLQRTITMGLGGYGALMNKLAQQPTITTAIFGPNFASVLSRNSTMLSAWVEETKRELKTIDDAIAGKLPRSVTPPGAGGSQRPFGLTPEQNAARNQAVMDAQRRYNEQQSQHGAAQRGAQSDARNGMLDAGHDIFRSVETPLEQFHRKMQMLTRLQQVGALPGGMQTYTRARADYWAEMQESRESAGPDGLKTPAPAGPTLSGAKERGSAEAWSSLTKALYPKKKNSQEKLAKEGVEVMKQVERNTRRGEGDGGRSIPP